MAQPRRPHPWIDIACPSDELFEVVGALLRSHGAGAPLPASIGSMADAFDVLVARHRLGPFLATRWVGAPAIEGLPAPTLARIHASRQRQQRIAAGCVAFLRELDTLCRGADLPFLVVKGVVLARRYYGDMAGRGYRDLDIMVREADRGRMEAVLQGMGAWRLSRLFGAASLSARFHHGFDYERDGVKLDLHWCMTRTPGLRCDLEAALDRSVTVDLGEQVVRALSPPDELHFLLVSAFADIQRGCLRLQSFVDIWELVRSLPDLDWPGFFAQREAEGSERLCRRTLSVLLASLRLAETAPALVDALGGCPAPRVARGLLRPSLGGVRGKLWAARALPIGLDRYVVWWALSLPFRVAASHPAWRRERPAAEAPARFGNGEDPE